MTRQISWSNARPLRRWRIFLGVLLVIAAMGSVKFAWNWRAAAAAAAFSAICGLLFVRLLGIPIPMFGTWLQAFGL